MLKNKKAQLGMGLIVGMLTSVIVFVMLSAFMPTIIQMLGTVKGSDSANCYGYTDPYGIHSYNATLAASGGTDSITCSIINFTPGLYMLSIIFAIIAGIISGKISQPVQEQQPYYPPY